MSDRGTAELSAIFFLMSVVCSLLLVALYLDSPLYMDVFAFIMLLFLATFINMALSLLVFCCYMDYKERKDKKTDKKESPFDADSK